MEVPGHSSRAVLLVLRQKGMHLHYVALGNYWQVGSGRLGDWAPVQFGGSHWGHKDNGKEKVTCPHSLDCLCSLPIIGISVRYRWTPSPGPPPCGVSTPTHLTFVPHNCALDEKYLEIVFC